MSTKDPASPSGPGPADNNGNPATGEGGPDTLPSGRKRITGKLSADDLKPLDTPRPRLSGKLSAADIAGPPELPRPPRRAAAGDGFEEAAVASRLRRDAQAAQSSFTAADLAAVEARRQERQHRNMPADSAFHRSKAPPEPARADPPATGAARRPRPADTQAIEDVAFKPSAPAPLTSSPATPSAALSATPPVVSPVVPPLMPRLPEPSRPVASEGQQTPPAAAEAAPAVNAPVTEATPPLAAAVHTAAPTQAQATPPEARSPEPVTRSTVSLADQAPAASPGAAGTASPFAAQRLQSPPTQPPTPPQPAAPEPEVLRGTGKEPPQAAQQSRWAGATMAAEDAVLRAPRPESAPRGERAADPVGRGAAPATAETPFAARSALPPGAADGHGGGNGIGNGRGTADHNGNEPSPSRSAATRPRPAARPVSPLPPGTALRLLLVLGLATGGTFLATLGWSTFGAWGMLPFSLAALLVLVRLANTLDTSGRWRATFVVALAGLLAFGTSVYLVQHGMGYWQASVPVPPSQPAPPPLSQHEADWRVMGLLLLTTAAAWVAFSRYKHLVFTWPVMLGFWLVLLESSGYSGAVDSASSRNLGLITVAFGIAVAGGAGWIYRRHGAGPVARDLAYHPYLCGSALALVGTWYAWPQTWPQYAAALVLLAAFAAGWVYAKKTLHALAWLGFSAAMVVCALLGDEPSRLVRGVLGL